ncbi:E1-E2 family cation-transporting ATPase [Limosilactobacillus frumenti DSM 13145]|uniref:E1-E2 family cation-transporting ATPase n=1 Tax=Limosilactobacillus frumenti DSM 13145 TaxID=1423746 RepID=A0A0R1P0U7_9LACO|nr:HAD-IC family P-type ATPase [Limosilactobacillus frumenti]KRL26141.1 E1-E2 family cation-transporting ATPase [Limosilactobacillus frumenti DSM 13145]
MDGLSTQEVQQRINDGQVNHHQTSGEKSFRQIVHDNVMTYFNLIFLIVTVLILIGHHYTISDFLYLPVVIANAVIGIFQEWRSQKTLRKLTIVNVLQVTVRRDGQDHHIKVDQLVRDDLLYLHAGDQISVDGQLVDGHLTTDESILTGEADEISKGQGDTLYSGSYVIAGDGMLRVTKVGDETYAAQLIAKAKQTDRNDQGEMVRAIDRIVNWIGILIIPLGMAMVYQSMVTNHHSFSVAISEMVAAVIGMIPEGLYLLVTVALATSAVRLAHHRVMIHDMHSIEQLSRVDTLCIDKTGTITEPDMQVTQVLPMHAIQETALKELIGQQVHQLAADNATMAALQKYFPQPSTIQPAARIIPFESANKYSALVYDHAVYAIGAPENLLKDSFDRYAKQIQQIAAGGQRVLAFGKTDQAIGSKLPKPIELLALIILQNPVRANAPATFDYFAHQDVAIKVISGDNPVTVSAVAKQADIQGAADYVDARQLKTDRQIQDAAQKYTIFGRVTPAKKQQLVQALQAQQHTVAMTGDGVNDILALKTADCSIAMATGASAAMNAASIVLLDSDFSMMPRIVDEGRQTVNNIQRSASLFLIKNIFSFLMALITIFTAMSYPLKSAQISLISAFMIGIPGYLLTFEPDHTRIHDHFTRTVMLNALPAALVDVFAIGLLMTVGQVFDIGDSDISTVSALIMAFVGIAMLIYLSQPLTWLRGIIIAVSAVGFIVAVTMMGDLFRFARPSLLVLALGIVFLLAAEAVLINFRWLFNWFNGLFSRGHARYQAGKHARHR